MRTLSIATICLALGFAAGCHPSEPESPVVGLTQPINPPIPQDLGRGAARVEIDIYNMYWSETVQNTCKGPDPFFKFDSSRANKPKNQPTMQVLAECMTEGALKGKSIRLIGRTDPRGSEEYNEKLGLERAEAVKRYLVTQGVPADRIVTTSLGKDDASPSPKDWPSDRRVQIELVP